MGYWQLLLAGSVVLLVGCRNKSSVPCEHLIGKPRTKVFQCVGGEKDDWQKGGIHRVKGKLYSILWREHGFGEVQDVVNWCGDEYWSRDLVVLRQTSDDPGKSRNEDPIVFVTRLRCVAERLWALLRAEALCVGHRVLSVSRPLRVPRRRVAVQRG